MPPLTTQLLGEEGAAPNTPFQFLEVNGFIYRGNRVTGEMWRLEAHATEKKTQVWKPIAEVSEATH